MIGKFSTLFILISILLGFLAEFEGIQDFSKSVGQQVSNESAMLYPLAITDADCEDCEKKECSNHNGHCSHHCSGIHNIIQTENDVSLKGPKGHNNSTLWYHGHCYKTPFLDPALKPPTFS